MASITYTITNTGGTILTSLVFTFTTPPGTELHADFSTIKIGEPSDFSGTTYTINDLSIAPTNSVTFSVDYTYLSGNDGTYNGSINVEGYSSTGSDSKPISIEVVINTLPGYWYNLYGNGVDSLWSNGVALAGQNIITYTETGRLLEYDTYGDVVSEKFITSTTGNNDFIHGMATTSTNDIYLPVFDLVSGSPQTANLYLIKLDSNKNIIWQKLVSTGYYNEPNKLLVDSGGNVIMIGLINNSNSNNKTFFVYKFDSNGNVIFKRHVNYFDSTSTLPPDDPTAVLDTEDNVYLFGYGWNQNGILFKLSAAGDVQWFIKLTSTAYMNDGLTIDDENNLYLSAWDSNYIFSFMDSYRVLLKINSSTGAKIFEKTYTYLLSNFDSPNGLSTMSSDGTHIYAAVDWYIDTPFSITTLLIKYDKNGNIIWQNLLDSATFGVYLEYWTNGNWITFNDTDIIIGTTATNFDDPEKIIVVKMPKTGVATSTYCSLDFDSGTRYGGPIDSTIVNIESVSFTNTAISQPSSDVTICSIADASPLPTFHCDIT